MKHVVATIIALSLSVPAIANESPLQTRFEAVCKAGFVLSQKATKACEIGKAPKALKSGKRFSNRSAIGAEFNTLFRQMKKQTFSGTSHNARNKTMERRETIESGYRAFNGHIFTEFDAISYNRVQAEINRWIDADRDVPEWLLNESHKQFCIIIGHI